MMLIPMNSLCSIRLDADLPVSTVKARIATSDGTTTLLTRSPWSVQLRGPVYLFLKLKYKGVIVLFDAQGEKVAVVT